MTEKNDGYQIIDGQGRLLALQAEAGLEELNDRIQEFLSRRGTEVPVELIKMLSDLDWLVRSDEW